jgi:hypothetical protein
MRKSGKGEEIKRGKGGRCQNGSFGKEREYLENEMGEGGEVER